LRTRCHGCIDGCGDTAHWVATDKRQGIVGIPGAGAGILEHPFYIHSLDLNTDGADFGARALASLLSEDEFTPADTVIAGSVTRADDLGRMMNGAGLGSRAAIQFRGLEAFTKLVQRAGWKITKIIDRPLSHDVLMEKA